MAAFFMASLSIIGLPPFGGLWSKWYLALGTLDTDQYVLLAVLLISTLLNIAYLIPIPLRAFFCPPEDVPEGGMREAPALSVIALSVTALGCFVLFLFPGPLYRLAAMLVAP
jgi:multicomponent Na+:H+ antiporter subunit D